MSNEGKIIKIEEQEFNKLYKGTAYKTKKIFEPTIFKINEDLYIKSQLCEKKGNNFYDISFVNGDNEFFIGRYVKEFNPISIMHKNDKVLICIKECIDGLMYITKVLSLYNILDNMLYSLTELEAIKIFDSSLNTSYLKHPNNHIYREDLEKVKRFK